MEQFTAFDGFKRVARGDLAAMVAAQREAIQRGVNLLIYHDATGAVRDVDLREAPLPARGRPKMGVKAREVTLLPRHWAWLGTQSGGASAALRRLVEAQMRAGTVDVKVLQERAYRFLSSIAGDLPGYEEALRALYAGDAARFADLMAEWPNDVRDYVQGLMSGT